MASAVEGEEEQLREQQELNDALDDAWAEWDGEEEGAGASSLPQNAAEGQGREEQGGAQSPVDAGSCAHGHPRSAAQQGATHAEVGPGRERPPLHAAWVVARMGGHIMRCNPA
jgi:hypothetical protein